MPTLDFVASDDPPWTATTEDPLLVFLHGYGSHERDLPSLTPFLPRLPWVSLRAPLAMGGGGAAWFPLELPGEPAAEAIDAATATLWEWLDDNLSPTTRIVPVGFSQGGLMALQLLRTRPARVAATVTLAGFVGTTSQPADSQLERERPPVFWGRGDADTVIWPEAIARTAMVLPQLSTLTAPVYPRLGHSVNETMLADVRTFLEDVLHL
jgi:phospholipase/carboxylesterase